MGLRPGNSSSGGADASTLTAAVLAALNTGTDILTRIKASAADALLDANLASTLNAVSSTVSHLVDNVTTAVVTALNTGTTVLSRVKASTAAAIAESWGTLLEASATTTGSDYVQVLAAPASGYKREIMSYFAFCTTAGGDVDQLSFTSGDGGVLYESFLLGQGATASRSALSPSRPLFTVTTGTLCIQAAEGFSFNYKAFITYRDVPT